MVIPFSPPYIDTSIEDEVISCLRSGWITSGPKVQELEKFLCIKYGIPHTVTCNSGTSAIMLVLHWFGIGEGDEVLIPAYTYAATALAVHHAGAKPVLVEVGEDFLIDPARISDAITTNTKAIIPVDLGGWPTDYAEIAKVVDGVSFDPKNEIQERLKKLLILGDAAHSIGAEYIGRMAGTFSEMTAFSFHAVKNITTAEGGAIGLNLPEPFDNEDVAKTLKLWTLNGQTKDALTKSKTGGWKYDIIYPGFKMNLPDVNAAIGLAQLRIYESKLLPRRREIFRKYNEAFGAFEWAQLPPFDNDQKRSSCHLYMLRIRDIDESTRDRIIDRISEKGVAVNVHFIPLPMLTVWRNMGYSIKDFPVAYDNYSREISIPIYPQLTDGEVEYVIQSVVVSVKEILDKEREISPSGGRGGALHNPTAPPQSPKGEVSPKSANLQAGEVAPLGAGGTLAEEAEMHYDAAGQLFSFSKELRENETPSEKELWKHLRKNLLGVKFRRQHPIGNYIADFYCHPARLIVELDGEYHQTEDQKRYDSSREEVLSQLGVKVIRFTNDEVFSGIDSVLGRIKQEVARKASTPGGQIPPLGGQGGGEHG